MRASRADALGVAGPAVASHRTGVVLIGVPGFSGTAVEVTSQRHRRRKSPDVIWHESFHLDPVDITHVAGIPTTTAARTLVDLATVLDDTGLLAVCDELLRRRLTNVAETVEVLDRLGARRHGAGRVRRVLDRRAADEPADEDEREADTVLLWKTSNSWAELATERGFDALRVNTCARGHKVDRTITSD